MKSPSARESPEKFKNPNLIKSVQNRNRAKENATRAFFLFFKNEIVSNRFRIKFSHGNQARFFLKSGCDT